jgi:sulfotransferase
MFAAVLPKMSGASEFAPFFNDERRYAVLRGVFDAYHRGEQDYDVVFDTNRIWTARLALISKLFPSSRVICCVRDVPWIIDSVERVLQRNPAQVSRLFGEKGGRNLYGRVDELMDQQKGLIGLSWTALREAWFGEFAEKLILVRYESLAKDPAHVMRELYDLLGQRHHDHDFSNIDYAEDNYDTGLGMPGLHTVRQKVEYMDRPTILPPDVFVRFAESSFWRTEKINVRNVRIL